MPKQYEAIRDKLVAKGMNYDKAQGHAAAIYNARHPNAPVTGSSEPKRDVLSELMKKHPPPKKS